MIREYTPTDLEAAVSLFSRAVREIASRDYSTDQVSAWAPERPDLAAWARRLETGAVFVCERNAGIAGFVRIDGTGCVELLYVDPQVQRQGVARALIHRVVSWALGQGIHRLHYEVSITARPFFESVGFRVATDQLVERRGVLFHNFRMERDINAESRLAAGR